MELSRKDQAIIAVAVALIMAIVLTFASYMAGQQTRGMAAIIASEGVVVDGRITNKVERFGGVLNGPKYTWWLDVSYTTANGATFSKTIEVDQSTYKRAAIASVAVTYIRSQPGTFFIGGVYDGANHSDADIGFHDGFTLYGVIVAVALGVALGVLLITRKGDGSPAPQGPIAPVRPSPRKPGQFGMRARRA